MIEKQLLEIFNLQNQLNFNTNGMNWKDGKTEQNKIINWKRCIYMECAELIDSFSWKHWKNIDGSIDRKNIEIELIDIFHFIASYLMVHNSIDESVKLTIQFIDEKSNIHLPKNWNNKNDNLKLDNYIEPFEELLALSLIKSNDITYQEELLKSFFIALDCAEVSFENMYKIYIGKNSLNIFRQQNGYKNGTYIKIWNGKEDNIILQEILENLDKSNNFSFENIYNELDKIYCKL